MNGFMAAMLASRELGTNVTFAMMLGRPPLTDTSRPESEAARDSVFARLAVLLLGRVCNVILSNLFYSGIHDGVDAVPIKPRLCVLRNTFRIGVENVVSRLDDMHASL